MLQFFYVWLVAKTLVCGCGPDRRRYDFDKFRVKYKISKAGRLTKQVTESSGLASGTVPGTYWTHNDGGAASALFQVDSTGMLLKELKINTLMNRDWEDLAQSDDGRLFIGDFGNNVNNRTDLAIYMLPGGWENGGHTVDTIRIRYAAQTRFPPAAKARRFDCEAFFCYNDTLYLFSKDTGRNPRYTRLYKVPAKAGTYDLVATDSLRLNETVTGADIRPDKGQFVLLTYGKLLFFAIANGVVDFSAPEVCLKKFRGQTEAVLYRNNRELLVTNEKGVMLKVSLK